MNQTTTATRPASEDVNKSAAEDAVAAKDPHDAPVYGLLPRLVLMSTLLVGLPVLAIVYVARGGATGVVMEYHGLHEVMVGVATALGVFIAYTAYRSYQADSSGFRYYLTLAFLAETYLYAFHGLFTRLSQEHMALFLLYGPVSRLIFALFLLAAAASLSSGTTVVAGARRFSAWLAVLTLASAAVAAFALSDLSSSMPVSPRLILEFTSLLTLSTAFSVMLRTRWIEMRLLRSLVAALLLFILASLAFLLVASPWDVMFWLAHAIFAIGFMMLGYAVLRARFGVTTLGQVFDIDELNARLRDQRMELVYQESLRGLSGGVAHHLNNSLLVVLGSAEMIHDSPSAGQAERQYARSCLKAGGRAAALCRQLLAYSGQAPLQFDTIHVDGLLEETAARWRLGATGVTPLLIEAEAGEASVRADRSLLIETLLELLDNARQSQPPGSEVQLVSRVETAPEGGKEHVLMSVIDQGSGMSPAILARARQPFFTTREVGSGAGLGLALADGVARSFGGTLTLDIGPSGGTIATIGIPLAVAD